MADRPSNTGREDTVALPLPANRPGAPAQGDSGGSSGSNGRVLPPMPPDPSTSPSTSSSASPTAKPSTSNGSRNGRRSATPPPKPPEAKRAAPRPAKPKPSAPPAQARKAPPPPPTTQPSLATQATAATRTTETARPAAAPPPVVAPAPAAKVKPAKQPQPAKPPRPTREDKKAARVAAAPRPGRRARLRLTRIDPWSVMKTSFLLSIALGIVIVVSVLMVWSVLGAADVWTSINKTVQDVVGGQDASTFDIEDYLGTRRVVGFTMIVAAVDVVLLTAICTLGAFLYNMSASLLGGVEVTLAEDN